MDSLDLPAISESHREAELIDYRDPARSLPALRTLGEHAWDAALSYVYDEAMRRPVGPETYRELRAAMFPGTDRPTPAPDGASSSGEVLREFSEQVAPHLYNAIHPRSFSYFTPAPLPIAVAADAIASWLNQSVDVFHAAPVAALVEEQVTRWLCELVRFPEGSWGVLTSGGNMANLMAMALVRERAREIVGGEGAGSTVVIYASDQVHFSIARALAMLGVDAETLRVVPTDDRFRISIEHLERSIAEDRDAGRRPCAVIGVAGSTNTGSVDDLDALADVAEHDRLWFHVDAAYGGGACFSTRSRDILSGLERADSVTLDPHKWMFQPIDIGALLVRRPGDLADVFRAEPEYYRSNQPLEEPLNWYEFSPEGTRRFRALKLWMSWKHLGTNGIGLLVDRTIGLARELSHRCDEASDMELAVERPDLSVVCFRHLPPGEMSDARLDAYQTALQRALEISGRAWVSTTVLRGRVFLRAGVMNHMTTSEDLDELLEAIRAVAGDALTAIRNDD